MILLIIVCISCFDNQKKITFNNIDFDNYSVRIYLQNNKPIYQKYFEKSKEIGHIDSIFGDSMHSFQEKKLVAIGKWKEAENKKLIYFGWSKLFYGDSIYNVEYTRYDPVNDINVINQQILYVNSKIDSSESCYYNLTQKGDSILLDVKTLYKPNRERQSYLRKLDKGKSIDSLLLKEGKNLLSKNFFDRQNRYSIRTYYLKDGKKTNWINMEIIN